MLKLIDRRHLSDIADAIRLVRDVDDTYLPSEMAEAIRTIQHTGAPNVVTSAFERSDDVVASATSGGVGDIVTVTSVLSSFGTFGATATATLR